MQISLNWLSDYLDLADLTPTAISDMLTSLGLEVEGIETQTPFTDEVVVGVILEASKHPNADTLQLCLVDIGEPEKLPIVCGAANARQGLHVAVAKVGATLPQDFKIKKSKIRGEVSCGMLCSEAELGLKEESEGILELKQGLPLGASVAKVLGLSDTVLTLNVTPNRADALGHIGVARDLAAKLKRPLRLPMSPLATDPALSTSDKVQVSIEDAQACARFVALAVTGVQTASSPAWLKRRLEAVGMRSINLIVDATNYAMLEFGQPVHAYDARSIHGGKLNARVLKDPCSFQTLDGQTRELEPGDIVISDDHSILALAGIMGGSESGIRQDTTEIIIEVASFQGRQIRRTARRLALHTDSSHRFERGTDPDALPLVARRVATLIHQGLKEQNLSLPHIADDFIDEYPADLSKRVIALDLSHARKILGLSRLNRDECVEALSLLGFDLLDELNERLVFEVPFFRQDIERGIDLIEEIGRIIGFERIPYQLPVMMIKPTPEDPMIDFLESLRLSLAQAGFRETISFPFLSESELEKLAIKKGHSLYPSLTLANPLNDQQKLLQTSLVPGLLRALNHNRRIGFQGASLFEIGRAYLAPSEPIAGFFSDRQRPSRHYGQRANLETKTPRPEGLRPRERSLLAAVIDQPMRVKQWNEAETFADFYTIKSLLWTLAKTWGIPKESFQLNKGEQEIPFLHPGKSALITLNGKALGYLGELHPQAATLLELSHPACPLILELDAERLFEASQRSFKSENQLSRFPPIARDLAFLCDESLTHARFSEVLKSFKRKRFLTRTHLFDVYAGKSMPSGKKSMAYTFYFQSPDRTLTDQEVEEELSAITKFLIEQLGLQQRI